MRGLLTLVFVMSTLWGADTRIQAVDQSKAPFPGVLVIIKSLENGREVGRNLTGTDGRIPPVRFETGLYRLIFTCPYGICATTVIEVLGQRLTGEFSIEVPMKPTDEHGIVVGEREVRISLRSPDDKPLIKAAVLMRNADASRERWYETDSQGSVNGLLPGDPATLVTIHLDNVYRYELSTHCGSQNAAGLGLPCYDPTGGQITIKLPR